MNTWWGARIALVLAVWVGTWSGAAAQAQEEGGDDEARVHFRLGRAYYESGRFNDAAREFQQAYDLSQRPALLYNIFVSHRDAGNLGPAIQALRSYLELVPDAEDREQLTSRLAAMERLQAERGGDAQAPPTATREPSTNGPSTSTSEPTTTSTTSQGGGTWTPGWIVAAVGGAAVVAGLITGGLALGAQGSLQSICDDAGVCEPGFESTRDSLALYSGLTDGLLFGGLAVAATGVLLAIVISGGSGSSDAPQAGLVCSPDGCAGTVRGFF